ncbi:ATPase family protein [Beauveria bassiana]|nr:ATPase family protein [Beauveria bassiana]KAH8713771.1 ATPase family 2 protein [Beauveria bassiana]
MVQESITVKVRPLSHPSLEKKSLLGAARLYVSKDSLIALTNGLESRPCVVERVPLDGDDESDPIRREASLCVLPEKNLSPNVVMMTRAFQDATGFRVGDQVRIVLRAATPDVEEVVVRDLSESEADVTPTLYPMDWRVVLNAVMNDAEQIFPGMVFDGVSLAKVRRNFKVLRVNGQSHILGRFRPGTSAIRILSPGEDDVAAAVETPGGRLLVTDLPGLADQVAPLNAFLRRFGRPFWVRRDFISCAFVVHGARGLGKTMILNRLAATGWGAVHWIPSSVKPSALRETFRQASAGGRPTIILLDELEVLLAKDRVHHDAIVETLAGELDALAERAVNQQRLPPVVVVAACLDYAADVPARLQKLTRLSRNIMLRLPRAAERKEILEFLDPPLREAEREACLASLASETHAFSGKDLAILVQTATDMLDTRLENEAEDAAGRSGDETEEVARAVHYLEVSDMELARRLTIPTAMHDINLSRSTIHWNDIGGQDDLKKILSRMIKNTKDMTPASRRVLRRPPKGLLLYGPPGCSKTLLAQALAIESSFNFFAVKGPELLNMYVGESERAVRTLFERARAASPSIIFFDEIDSIGGRRNGGDGGAASRGTSSVNILTALLTEVDGFERLHGVLVVAATNRPDAMDPALLRAGRFDKIMYVGPPDEAARAAIFAVHLRGLSLAADVDCAELARLAEGFSGAEIEAICTTAGTAALERYEDAVETGGEAKQMEITMEDLRAALCATPKHITEDMINEYKKWSQKFIAKK